MPTIILCSRRERFRVIPSRLMLDPNGFPSNDQNSEGVYDYIQFSLYSSFKCQTSRSMARSTPESFSGRPCKFSKIILLSLSVPVFTDFPVSWVNRWHLKFYIHRVELISLTRNERVAINMRATQHWRPNSPDNLGWNQTRQILTGLPWGYHKKPTSTVALVDWSPFTRFALPDWVVRVTVPDFVHWSPRRPSHLPKLPCSQFERFVQFVQIGPAMRY
jgi:hypothetical protein